MPDKTSALARMVMRPWLLWKQRPNQKALEDAFEVVKDQAISSREQGFKGSATIFNMALYILIAERDVQALKIDALTHRDEWKRKLCMRVILLTIHELNLDKAAGTALRDALAAPGISNDTKTKMIAALRLFRGIQKKAETQIAPLRNTAIAHRDADAVLQTKAIEDLNATTVFSIAEEFYVAVRKVFDALPNLVRESARMHSLLHQWLQSHSKDKD
jgi:hypothetical protein